MLWWANKFFYQNNIACFMIFIIKENEQVILKTTLQSFVAITYNEFLSRDSE